MWSVELDTTDPRTVERVLRDLQRAGVLAYPFERGLSLFPALTIGESELDTVADRIAACVAALSPVG